MTITWGVRRSWVARSALVRGGFLVVLCAVLWLFHGLNGGVFGGVGAGVGVQLGGLGRQLVVTDRGVELQGRLTTRTVHWSQIEELTRRRLVPRLYRERTSDTGLQPSWDADVLRQPRSRRALHLRPYLDEYRWAQLADVARQHRPDLFEPADRSTR